MRGETSPGEFEGVPDSDSGRTWLREWGERGSAFAERTVGVDENPDLLAADRPFGEGTPAPTPLPEPGPPRVGVRHALELPGGGLAAHLRRVDPEQADRLLGPVAVADVNRVAVDHIDDGDDVGGLNLGVGELGRHVGTAGEGRVPGGEARTPAGDHQNHDTQPRPTVHAGHRR